MLNLLASAILACNSLTAVDGDTIKCDGVNMRDMGPGAPFVSGYDTPEVGRAQCDRERELGESAKARMEELLAIEGVFVEDSGQRDRTQSRRPLVWVRMPDGRTAGDILLDEGYAVKWLPNQSPHDWCR